ncbi:MAG: FecR domain-containing protein [Proteobacteria bacterium]|nr:hypothetical protein [Desulfobacula sp.]MBU4131758.1 FecR domain-containing protein [Pseudomonadota bacterium]
MKFPSKNMPVFIFLFSFLFFHCGDVFASNTEMATLKEFSGEVMIKNAEKWISPEKDLKLYSGTKIVTRQGTALVVFKDGATMNVDPFSSIRAMDQMKEGTSGSETPDRLRSIRIMLGRTKYEEQPVKGRSTQIELPTAVAALRGTGGWFGADETGDSLGKLYEGDMETFGPFKEMVPKILSFAQALSSATWQASVTSSGASSDALLNIREIQAEMNTFVQNTDPAIQASVQQTLSQVQTVLSDLETKQAGVQQAQEIKQRSESETQKETPATAQEVKDTNRISVQAANAYISAAKESMNTDIVLILETLKGDKMGMAIARQAKANIDQALGLAGNATQLAGQAADLANTATSDDQRKTALAVVNAASSTVEAAGNAIKATNSGAQLMARDDEAGAVKTETLSNVAARSLGTAAKSVRVAAKAITAGKSASTPQAAALAQTLAAAAQRSSKAVAAALQVSNLAARAITQQNTEKADSLIQTSNTAARSVETMDSAMDAIQNAFDNNDTNKVNDSSNTINQGAQKTQETTQPVIDAEPPEVPEAYEPANAPAQTGPPPAAAAATTTAAATPTTTPAARPVPPAPSPPALEEAFVDDAAPASPI